LHLVEVCGGQCLLDPINQHQHQHSVVVVIIIIIIICVIMIVSRDRIVHTKSVLRMNVNTWAQCWAKFGKSNICNASTWLNEYNNNDPKLIMCDMLTHIQ
jgi:hypothetical protein